MKKNIKKNISLLINFLKRKENFIEFYENKKYLDSCFFERSVTIKGVTLPVYSNYRYSKKPAWYYYGPLSALSDLDKLSLLEPMDHIFLNDAIGRRTLTVSLNECREVLNKYIHRHGELFISKRIPDLGKRLLKPIKKDIVLEVQAHVRHHRRLLQKLTKKELLKQGEKSLKVLEIGYTSGGTSLIAFENLGAEAHGIDYFFAETVDRGSRHEYIKNLLGSNVQYHFGDITKQTVFDVETFDIVYSSSTIEHIKNLPDAFKEIRRILKPGGLSIHKYDPFFHPLGGHSLGTLDSPWGHVRLTQESYFEYLKELRPYESDIAIQWVKSALNSNYTMSKVQWFLLCSGFNIIEWENQYVNQDERKFLSHEIMSDAFSVNPNLTIQDLLTRKVSFISQKGEFQE